MVRTRQSAGNTHIADRMPIVVARPFTATSCGCGDGSGYRSTAPALVAVVETAEDVQDAWDAACDALEDVTQEQWDAVTSGHPIEECGALYCRVRLAVRPAGVDARRVTR